MGKMGLPDPVSFATAAEEKKKDIYREKNLAKVNKFCNTTKAKKKVHLTECIKLSLSFCGSLVLAPVFQPFLFDIDFYSSCILVLIPF